MLRKKLTLQQAKSALDMKIVKMIATDIMEDHSLEVCKRTQSPTISLHYD